jgi:hypothetical protein
MGLRGRPENPDRNQTEAKLAGLAGVVPISATSGLPMKQHGTTR